MSASNPSAMLADALSVFSKAAYKSFSEVESQSRQEVARAAAEIREAKTERDQAIRELHTFQLEFHSCKQEIAASKAALAQAELTVAHQAETLASQNETIAQLRRELTQWKDQSRNWQEHFLRVEQERCVQSSRIDELVAEKLQYARSVVNPNALFTPPKLTKYGNGVNAEPSTTTKGLLNPSPTQPPAYKSAAPPSPLDIGPTVVTPPQTNANGRSTQKQVKSTGKSAPRVRDVPPVQEDQQDVSSTSLKRPRKSTINVQSAQKAEVPASEPRSSTVIRRVHAVINVKQEEDSEEDEPVSGQFNNAASSSAGKREEARSSSHGDRHRQPKKARPSRSQIIHDDDAASEDIISDNLASGSESDEFGPPKIYNPPGSGRFRNRSRINYKEEDEDEDEEEDELMMGAEENHDEVYGTKRVEDSRPKHLATSTPAKKKRKIAAR